VFGAEKRETDIWTVCIHKKRYLWVC